MTSNQTPGHKWKLWLRKALGIHLGHFEMYEPRPLDIALSASSISDIEENLRFSIVTPVFNQRRYIEATINSVFGQRYSNVEYIVIDGGSSDGTRELLERYAEQFHVFESSPDRGQSHAINKGFAYSSGDLLSWINGDDILLPGALKYVSDFFEAHPEIDVVYGHRIVIDSDGNEVGRWVLPPHNDRVLSWVDFVPQETLFWRRSAWEQVGGRIDESFSFAMDWDLLIRFRDRGLRIARLPRFLGAFRVHPSQKTSSAMKSVGMEEMRRIRMRCLGYAPAKFIERIATAPYILQHMALRWVDQYFHLYC